MKDEYDSPVVRLAEWVVDGDEAHIVRSLGVRVILHYSPEGNPTMHVEEAPGTPPDEEVRADKMMWEWNRAVLKQVSKGTDRRVRVLEDALRKVETAHFGQLCALCLGGEAPSLHTDDCPVGIALSESADPPINPKGERVDSL